MQQRRWGEDTPADATEARERLLDSADACFARFGLNKTTIDDIAANAKVSRATVYRYFDGRDAIILGVFERDVARLSEEIAFELEPIGDLASFVVDSIVLTVEGVRANTNLAILFAPHAAGITAEIVGAWEALFDMNAAFLRPYLERARAEGELEASVDLAALSEWVLRITLSLLTVRGPTVRSRDEMRDFLLVLLGPVLGHP